MSAARDIPLRVTSASSSSERRITPSWTLSQLKAKLEPITGISSTSQKLTLHLPDQTNVILEALDEESVQVGSWPLVSYAELHVSSVDASSNPSFSPPSEVPKYVMPIDTYSSLSDTVLAYKKSHQIGRFDPHATENQDLKIRDMWKEIEEQNIKSAARCILNPGNTRRGTIAYVGLVPELPGAGPWIGVKLDEPTGKNDGTIRGKRYFEASANQGVFVRADRVEVGDWGELGLEDNLEEI